jgi:hypothetical protein
VCQRAVDQRRFADHVEAGGGTVVAGPAGEAVGEPGLALAQHADPVVAALVQHPAHLGAPVDGDQHERRLERHRHERVGRHAVHLLALQGRDHRDPGGEHPERLAQRQRGIVSADVRLLFLGELVERAGADPVGPGPAERELELGSGSVAHERGRVLPGS